ncbi:MAG: hypothetical protein JWO83_827 [Caulobacteraceae bacterium]|nr:hypothetical protein [Caulobacteraceae bacterium]
MILTCPRCATRYLADPLQVWATGRTVQCEACGQRWRAVGKGVRPAAQAEPPPPADPPAEDPVAPVDEPPPAESAKAVEPEFRAEPRRDPWASAPVESERPTEAETPAEAADQPATPPDASPVRDDPLNLARPPSRLTSSFGSGPSRAGRWLAIAFLVVIALAAVLMFRDVIVSALPGLAPIYAAMGLLVHPAAVPHG